MQSPRLTRFRPALERLETREVPAAVTADLRGGVLTAIGTNASDQISVYRVAGTIVVYATTTQNGAFYSTLVSTMTWTGIIYRRRRLFASAVMFIRSISTSRQVVQSSD